MKNQILSFAAVLMSLFSFSQTATNFNVNDCSGANHDLFTELNSGKVIVLCWVMPCSSCIGPAISAYNTSQNYATSNPGQVLYYLCDDIGNTSCSTINSWANANGIINSTRFSNAAINENDYGGSGMPHIVVLGGTSHTIFFDEKNSVNTTNLTNAINNALATVGVEEINNNNLFSLKVFPNPSNTQSTLSLTLSKEAKVKIEIQNLLGQKISDVFTGNLPLGEHAIKVNTTELAEGNYFINCLNGSVSEKIKLVVTH